MLISVKCDRVRGRMCERATMAKISIYPSKWKIRLVSSLISLSIRFALFVVMMMTMGVVVVKVVALFGSEEAVYAC